MSGGKNQRALLMEILVAVLFFGLCATVLLQTFTAARESSARAGAHSAAITHMQVLADQLYAADDMQSLLQAEGFALESDQWLLRAGDYDLAVQLSEEETGAGMLLRAQLRAMSGEAILAEIPCARYLPKEGAA